MDKKTRKITFVAMLASLSVVLLYIASVIPSSRIGVTALAGLLTAAALIEYGISAGIACYFITAVVSALLIPLKSVALMYIIFFGCYPVIKSLIERIKKRAFEWLLKLLVFNFALTLIYLLWHFGFLSGVSMGVQTLLIIYAGGNFCFVLYDYAFSKLVLIYYARFYRKR